ncbi:MAG TPA: Asp-tRNA(Asn)/Glu-tRNA(Gln) amidotransferase subunit GatC [Acidobacteriaceae bacterium]
MSVSEKDVLRVAELANLELTADERARMLHDLNSILGHIAQLNELDTASVQPMAQVGEQLQEWKRPDQPGGELRADELRPSLDRSQVLACAPETDGVFFKVPRVIER